MKYALWKLWQRFVVIEVQRIFIRVESPSISVIAMISAVSWSASTVVFGWYRCSRMNWTDLVEYLYIWEIISAHVYKIWVLLIKLRKYLFS